MTSAQNHHQLLNGNKFPILVLLLLVIAQGCFLFKKKESEKEEEIETEIIEPDEPTESPDTSEPTQTEEKEDTRAIDNFYRKKDTYKISLLLPLHLDSIKADTMAKYLFPSKDDDGDKEDEEEKENVIPEECRLGLSFYQGVLSAVDTLEEYGVDMSIRFFDTKNSKQHVKKLFLKDDIQNSDLIIGPVYNKPLAFATQKAKQFQIPLVSPLSPKNVTNKANPYFYMANPTLNAHLDTLHSFLQTKHQKAHKILLYQENEFEQQKADYIGSLDCPSLKTENDSAKKQCYNRYTILQGEAVQTIDFSYVDSLLVEDSVNVVMVPSFDEAFVNIVTRELNTITGNYKIYLYGMPSWLEMSTLRLEYLDSLHLHYTTPYYLDRQSERYKEYEQAFIDSFHTLPSEVSMKAFDLTVYFGRLLNEYGPTFWRNFPPPASTDGLITSFNFQPIRDSTFNDTSYAERRTRMSREGQYRMSEPDSSIRLFKNKSIHMMRYKDFEVIHLK
jgi:hypothetical protein